MSTSVRTQVRDGIVEALQTLLRQGAARHRDFAVSLTYDTVEECTKWPTYCVIVTDETLTEQTLRHLGSELNVLTVLYVRDTKDPRAALDAAIEDVYEAVAGWCEQARGLIWKWRLAELSTDEGTRIAKPHAQAVLRWSLAHRRAIGHFNG
jgi:hypothetical protein